SGSCRPGADCWAWAGITALPEKSSVHRTAHRAGDAGAA
nr:hypothetical protein [Tanacetum cinerariifolium]